MPVKDPVKTCKSKKGKNVPQKYVVLVVGRSNSKDILDRWIGWRVCLKQSAVVNHKDCHSKFHNRGKVDGSLA